VAREQALWLHSQESSRLVGNLQEAQQLLSKLPTRLRTRNDCQALKKVLEQSLHNKDDTLSFMSLWAHNWFAQALNDFAKDFPESEHDAVERERSNKWFERWCAERGPRLPGPRDRALPGNLIEAREDVADAMRQGATKQDAVDRAIARFAPNHGYSITAEADLEELRQYAAKMADDGGPRAYPGHMAFARSAIVAALKGGVTDPQATERDLRARFEQNHGYPLSDHDLEELRQFAVGWDPNGHLPPSLP
jgi:hypothetical protein